MKLNLTHVGERCLALFMLISMIVGFLEAHQESFMECNDNIMFNMVTSKQHDCWYWKKQPPPLMIFIYFNGD